MIRLDASPHSGNTIVVFTSDHGFHIGEQSLWGKTSNFELDARVPLIIADPNRIASHDRKTKSLAELVDLYPTLADLAGIRESVPANLEGTSLVPILDDPNARVKQAAFTQHQHPFYGKRDDWVAWGYSVRTDRWRYTQWRSIKNAKILAEELYDHENDPGESRNVATEPSSQEVTQSLSALLN